MNLPTRDKIELLPVSLLDEQRPRVEALKALARELGLEFGWHYLLDLSWILRELGDVQGKRIIDAGAGTGLIQWYLAENGAEVISIDRGSRADLPLRFRNRFQVSGLRSADLLPASEVVKGYIKRKVNFRRDLFGAFPAKHSPGQVTIYNQDLKNLPDIPDNSIDAVVAVSALEHNTSEGLEAVVTELMRVLRPGGLLVATLCAARDEDRWHVPSSGWCYTDSSLRRLFCLSPAAISNYDRYDEIFEGLKNCAELRDNLARFYSRSGDNGMPWGKWDPQYGPVGVCKAK